MLIAYRSALMSTILMMAAMTNAAQIQPVSYNGCSSCGTEGCSGVDGCNDGHCPNGRCRGDRCTLGSTWNDCTMNWCGRCGPTGRLCRMGCKPAQAICWCCNTKAFPDAGWAPPANVPIHRQGGTYQTYWPGQWYGNPGGGFTGGAPMVYQPTDTTQLGYSYSNVPTWRPNPGMIPPVPYPSSFHNRICPGDPTCGGCIIGGMTGGEYCPTGHCELQYVQMTNGHRNQMVHTKTGPSPAALPVPSQGVGMVRLTTRSDAPAKPHPAAKSLPQPQTDNNTGIVQKPLPALKPQAGVRQVSSEQQVGTSRSAATRKPHAPSKTPQKASDGWFGLPSLSEVKF